MIAKISEISLSQIIQSKFSKSLFKFSSSSKSKLSQTQSSKSESEMQEICLDSDSLEELVMVIEDIVNKRQTSEIAGDLYTISNLGNNSQLFCTYHFI